MVSPLRRSTDTINFQLIWKGEVINLGRLLFRTIVLAMTGIYFALLGSGIHKMYDGELVEPQTPAFQGHLSTTPSQLSNGPHHPDAGFLSPNGDRP